MARYSISIEFGPVKKRSTYIGLMNTVLAPLYLCGMLGGILGARWGLKTVFAIGAAFSIAGILILLFRVEEPVRHGSPH
jgi:MFS family permease